MKLESCNFAKLILAAINEAQNNRELLTSLISRDLALISGNWKSITMDIKVGNTILHQLSKNVVFTLRCGEPC
ncbi:Uncharacterized protein APZ42_024280 [Daphnia magna]|uniref:Uncharacterized protein n=1 Tax=Daphnia magna TaxID=35525 RepID=A0A164ULP5_9CRUS|nr:Uncharacterized protein APZ42_024280 [Daphnia magna]